MATSIGPGEVRAFKRGDGNAIVIGLGLWAARQGKWLEIHMTGPEETHTTVNNNAESVRYHPTLFRNLRKTLVENDCWPFEDEGAEVGNKESESRFRPVPIRGEPLSATVIADRG